MVSSGLYPLLVSGKVYLMYFYTRLEWARDDCFFHRNWSQQSASSAIIRLAFVFAYVLHLWGWRLRMYEWCGGATPSSASSKPLKLTTIFVADFCDPKQNISCSTWEIDSCHPGCEEHMASWILYDIWSLNFKHEHVCSLVNPPQRTPSETRV